MGNGVTVNIVTAEDSIAELERLAELAEQTLAKAQKKKAANDDAA